MSYLREVKRMHDVERIRKMLLKLMDEITAIEGIIAISRDGSIISSESISRSPSETTLMKLAKTVQELDNLSRELGKGMIKEVHLVGDEGYVIIASSPTLSLIALAGLDARAQLGLIMMNLRKILDILA